MAAKRPERTQQQPAMTSAAEHRAHNHIKHTTQQLPLIAPEHPPLTRGVYHRIDRSSLDPATPTPYFSHQHGEIWVGDSLAWLPSLETASVDLVFADPPYNIKKAEWDTFNSQQHYVEWSLRWIEEAEGAKPRDVIEIPTTCNGMH